MGLIQKWLTEYLPKRDKCWKNRQTDAANHTVNMDDMQGSFFVLFLGMVDLFISSFIFRISETFHCVIIFRT